MGCEEAAGGEFIRVSGKSGAALSIECNIPEMDHYVLYVIGGIGELDAKDHSGKIAIHSGSISQQAETEYVSIATYGRHKIGDLRLINPTVLHFPDNMRIYAMYFEGVPRKM